MKTFVSVLVGVGLAALAVYFLLFGGIVQIVGGATAHPVDSVGIAAGAVRVLCTSLAIWVSVVLGAALRGALD